MGHLAHVKKIVAGIGVFTALTAMTITPAFAAESDNSEVSATIKAGTRSVSTDNFSFVDGTYSFSGSTLSAIDVLLNATDETGTYAGWQVTMSATDFTNGTGTSIWANGFSVTTVNPVTPTGNNGELHAVAMNTGVLTGEGQVILVADEGAGHGTYTAEMDFALNVPGTVPAGTYSSTLTTTIGTAVGVED